MSPFCRKEVFTKLYKLMLYLLQHVINGQERFEFLEVLDLLPTERFKVHIKLACRTTSQPEISGKLGTVGIIDIKRRGHLETTDGMRNSKRFWKLKEDFV